ncbi:LIM/homeobox protein Lhx9-like [Arctopsyche grandis]|uniref:LIM/homeobox protein Lhx9-like n=1 Tax=Arctopsyche grandis TaxID=121162 RepID=UPI00406D891D
MLKDRQEEGVEESLEEALGVTSSAPEECGGCGGRIQDRYYLLAADRRWHGNCLRCCECHSPLAAELTCFTRDRNIYCKDDYYRMFCVKRCARCQAGISANELVMRAREMVYHLGCFTCVSCGCLLSKGDTFGMRDGLIYCRPHYELIFNENYCEEEIASMFRANGSPSQYFPTGPVQKGRPRKRKPPTVSPDALQLHAIRMAGNALEILHPADLNSSMESLSYDSSVASPGSSSGRHSQRTKRMRTSFKHHQLRTMKSYFAINQNPDAKDLKQLAQKTGLSKRVLQVWFQNARAKWRRNMLRQDSNQNGSAGSGVTNSTVGAAASAMHHQLHPHHTTLPFADLY